MSFRSNAKLSMSISNIFLSKMHQRNEVCFDHCMTALFQSKKQNMTDTFQDTLQSVVIIMQIFEHNVPPCATDLEFLKLNAQSSLTNFNQVCDNVFNFMPKAYFKKSFSCQKKFFIMEHSFQNPCCGEME